MQCGAVQRSGERRGRGKEGRKEGSKEGKERAREQGAKGKGLFEGRKRKSIPGGGSLSFSITLSLVFLCCLRMLLLVRTAMCPVFSPLFFCPVSASHAAVAGHGTGQRREWRQLASSACQLVSSSPCQAWGLYSRRMKTNGRNENKKRTKL